MKQIFKYIIKVLLLALFILWGVIFIVTTYFSDDIEKSIISKIQQSLEAPLILDNVRFTIYDNFPYASVKIKNLPSEETEIAPSL